MSFHINCGKRIKLTNNNRTASRNVTEFNHGLVLSSTTLKDNALFEVKIDEKVRTPESYSVIFLMHYGVLIN